MIAAVLYKHRLVTYSPHEDTTTPTTFTEIRPVSNFYHLVHACWCTLALILIFGSGAAITWGQTKTEQYWLSVWQTQVLRGSPLQPSQLVLHCTLLTSEGVPILSVNSRHRLTTKRTFTTLTDVSFHTIIQYTLTMSLCSSGLEIQF